MSVAMCLLLCVCCYVSVRYYVPLCDTAMRGFTLRLFKQLCLALSRECLFKNETLRGVILSPTYVPFKISVILPIEK